MSTIVMTNATYADLLGGIRAAFKVGNSAADLVGNVMSIVGSSRAESLTNSFEKRGFSDIKAEFKMQTRQFPTKKMRKFVQQVLRAIKFPRKYGKQVNDMCKNFLDRPKEESVWVENDLVFSTGKGGNCETIQFFFHRIANDYDDCDEVQMLVAHANVDFKLARDIFVITTSTSRLGGAFNNVNYREERRDASLTVRDAMFVSQYFQLTAFKAIEESRELAGMATKPDKCENLPPFFDPWAKKKKKKDDDEG